MPENLGESGCDVLAAAATLPGREQGLLKGGPGHEGRSLGGPLGRREMDADVQVVYSDSIDGWIAGRGVACGRCGGRSAIRNEIHKGNTTGKEDRKDRKDVGSPTIVSSPTHASIFSRASILIACFIRMADAADDKKTVTVRMSDEEVKALSRTRRRRRGAAAQRGGAEPRADMVEASAEAPIVQKLEAKETPVPAAGGTTAAIPAVPGTAKPRIVFTKKNTITKDPVTKKADKKPVLVIPIKKEQPKVELVKVEPVKVEPVKVEAVKDTQAKKRRRFKARRLRMTLNARGGAGKTVAKRVAAMSISDVRSQLIAAKLLKGKSRSPPDVLRGMLTEWLQLHAGA